jgi:hypothetical protein
VGLKTGEGQKELEAENSRLKRMYAELSLEVTALKDLIEKKHWGHRNGGTR